MTLNRWNWGYIPVIVVLGLIWFEFWQSRAPAPPPQVAQAPGTQVAATAPQPALSVTRPASSPSQPAPEPPRVEAPRSLVVDEVFLNNPPPISLSVTNATLDTVTEALRKSLIPSCKLQANNSQSDRKFTLDAKNVPFWDIFKSLAAQNPMEIVPANDAGTTGLVLNGSGAGVYRFERNGPAILYPISIVYAKSSSGQANPADHVAATYNFELGAAVDPRINVTRCAPVDVLSAVDEQGRKLALPAVSAATNYMDAPTNGWNTSVDFPAPEPPAKRATFKCQIRFAVQLPELTATVEDATQKTGQIVTLGERRLRLVRCAVQANQLSVQIAPETPEPQSPPIFCTVIDANGRSISLPTQADTAHNIPLTSFVAPYRLVFRAPERTRDVTLPFELKDVPLP